MSDPLSVAASIVAILELTRGVIEYLNNVRSASKERQRLLDEVTSITGFLYVLKDRSERSQNGDSWTQTLASLKRPNGPLEQFKLALESLTEKLSPGEGWRKGGKALTWPFQKEEARDILAAIERHKSLFSLALQNDHLRLSEAIKDDFRSLRDKADKIDDGVTRLQTSQQTAEDQRILNWLSPLEFPLQFSDFISRRQEGTGTWLLESDEFKMWLNQPRQTIFCAGIPGSGKTMMTSIVIDHLSNSFQGKDVGIAYIYCNYQSGLQQTTLNLLASLLKQLLQNQPCISNDVRHLFERHYRKQTRPTLDEVFTTLLSEIGRYSRTYVLVDALDECAEDGGTRKQLLARLNSLRAVGTVNLMVTSRFIPKIQQEFQSALQLEIRARREDVENYLRRQVHLLPACVNKSVALQENIISEITKSIDGMFLLARLHLDSLADKTSPKAIKSALNQLPIGSAGLDIAYDQAMGRIMNQKPGLRELAKQVLSWTICAKRPLTVHELQHALAVEPGQPDLDEDNFSDIEELVSVCAGLVVVDQESGIVRLVHYTTQEYFQRIRLNRFPDAEKNIGTICLRYLLFDTFEEGSCWNDDDFNARLQKYAFLDYAARHWGDHLREDMEPNEKILALEFLTSGPKVSCSSQVMLSWKFKLFILNQHTAGNVSALHLCAHFGLLRLMMELQRTEINKDPKDSRGRTPLSWAAERGHEEVVIFLIVQLKVEANSKDCYMRTPIHWAAQGGREAVLKLLLEHLNVPPDSEDAAEAGNETVARLLVERVAKVDSKDKNGQTPLSLAAEEGHEVAIGLLIERGAKVDSKDKTGRTPLSWAATGGHEVAIGLLIERGAKVDSKDKNGQTPLSWAAEEGHEVAIGLLIERGAKVDSKDEDGRTPLSWAAELGHDRVIRLLLDRDDVMADSEDECHKTPLSWAAIEGKEGAMRLLLERRDVDINHRSSEGLTPLSYAVRLGHRDAAWLLLDQVNIVVDSMDSDNRTLLSWAAQNGDEDIVRLLLRKYGVIANFVDANGRTPLSWAAEYGREAVVKMLLERDDVIVDSRDETGRTPTSWAVGSGHWAVARLLGHQEQDVDAASEVPLPDRK